MLKIDSKYLLLTALFAFILFFQKCSHDSMLRDEKNSYNALLEFERKEKDQLIQDKNLQASAIEQMNQNIVSQNEAMRYLGDQVEDYKRLTSYMKAELKTEIKNLKIDFSGGEIPPTVFNDSCVHVDTVKMNYTRIPRYFSISDQWSSISGSVDKSGIVFDSISFINKFDVTIGKKKTGFMKSEPVIELKSYNPYTSIPYVNNIVVTGDKTLWFNTRAAWFGYGFITSFVINKKINGN